jgi:hypothetical protein
MAKTIKLREDQYNKVMEMTFAHGIDAKNNLPDYQMSTVNADGVLDKGEMGNPTTSKDIDVMTKNFPWGVGRTTRSGVFFTEEQGNISDMYNDTDQSGDGVKDMFNHADANELTDGNENDDACVIPMSIERHADRLISAINTANLPPKKLINLVNKIIDSVNIGSLPPSYKKETSMKILAK